MSNFPIRELGDGQLLSEEDRESHVHCLGSPGEGKSKFLELLLRQDIDNGYGACLLDPSDNGDTCYKVLKYAIKKGHTKIVLIDPHDISVFNVVPTIQPIHYKAPAPAVIGGLMDAIRVLWGQGSFTDTPRIQKYLPAVIAALHASKMTMAECRYFMDNSKIFEYRRNKIIEPLHDFDLHKRHLVSAFSGSKMDYENFQSTVNRLMPFLDPTMELIFGSNDTPMNFLDLVSQGYLVLVNLDPEGVFGQEHQRLLGTIIINEITYAISRLRNSGWRGVYYLYIDEAGDYATSKLSYILDKKRKSGLRLTLSHQRFDQFSDKDVSSAVYGGTKIKVLFNTANPEDRLKMIRMMYGGDLSDRDVSYALSQLKKQNAVIKINKQPPVSMRLTDVPDIQMPAKELAEWKEQHYKSNPWYRSIQSVREEINNRFAIRSPKGSAAKADAINKPVPAKEVQPASGDNPVTDTTKRDAQPSPAEDSHRPSRSTVFDNLPGGGAVLRGKSGRATRKRPGGPPKAE